MKNNGLLTAVLQSRALLQCLFLISQNIKSSKTERTFILIKQLITLINNLLLNSEITGRYSFGGEQ